VDVTLEGKGLEVDLMVPSHGLIVENKQMRPFGLGTKQWTRTRAQIRDRLDYARSPGGGRRVNVIFSRGVSPEVARAVSAMGSAVEGKVVSPREVRSMGH
jgi:hypothetical protein